MLNNAGKKIKSFAYTHLLGFLKGWLWSYVKKKPLAIISMLVPVLLFFIKKWVSITLFSAVLFYFFHLYRKEKGQNSELSSKNVGK